MQPRPAVTITTHIDSAGMWSQVRVLECTDAMKAQVTQKKTCMEQG